MSISSNFILIRHNKFFLPLVNQIFERLYRDVDSDYYGIINADILISDYVFVVLDEIDRLVASHSISSIVDNYFISYL